MLFCLILCILVISFCFVCLRKRKVEKQDVGTLMPLDAFVRELNNLSEFLGGELRVCSLLGISERTLNKWKKGDFTHKYNRFTQLYRVVKYITVWTDEDPWMVLNNGRIYFEHPLDDECDSICLAAWICAHPDNDKWQGKTIEALEDAAKYENRSVRWRSFIVLPTLFGEDNVR